MTERVLYSYVRCPFAARARLALIFSAINCQLREVDLAHKPAHMLQLSPKGTVPVLQLDDKKIIDESLDVMHWAVQSESGAFLRVQNTQALQQLIEQLDGDFSKNSFRYRFRLANDPHPASYYREQCERFVQRLEQILSTTGFLAGDAISFADLAVYPFLRGFVDIEPDWFNATPYGNVHRWLSLMAADLRVQQAFVINKPWQDGDKPVYLLSA